MKASQLRNSAIARMAGAFVILCAVNLHAQVKYSGGTGQPNDPYRIATAIDLIALGNEPSDYGKYFILTADIDLDPNLPGGRIFDKAMISPDTNDTEEDFQGTAFTGVLDGRGHTISNFTYASKNRDYAGVFGRVSFLAVVKDVDLMDPHVLAEEGNNVGALVGDGGQIFNCHVEGGSVAGKDSVGGLVGSASSAAVTDCSAQLAVSGHEQVGGLVGCAVNAGICDSFATGSVTGDEEVGGLVGYVPRSRFWAIADSYSWAVVSGNKKIGGLAGSNYGRVINCYSVGRVTGNERVGGLVGYNEGEITASFWNTQTSGIVTSAGGLGKTTAEMWDAGTYEQADWDFQGKSDGSSEIWAVPEGRGYPVLWWQIPASRLPPLPTFSGGAGRAEDPYVISTPGDLTRIGHNPRLMAAHFILANDIDLAGMDFHVIGSEGIPFTGVFNGNGKQVLNLICRSTARGCIGFIGRIKGPNAAVRDLHLVDASIDGGTGDCVGSLVGDNWEATIANCSARGGSIQSSGGMAGGLAGYSDGSVSCSYATCGVWGNEDVGGVVGCSAGAVRSCYSSGSVSGREFVGGLVGDDSYGTVTQCYSTGAVTGKGSSIGGLAGAAEVNDVTVSFWDTETSGQTTSAGGTGKTTAEMQMAATYLGAGWDFMGETANGTQDIWWIDAGKDYPHLWFEAAR